MAARRKTWVQKRESAKEPHVDTLRSAFAGLPAGAALLIPSPNLVAEYVREIPQGQARTIAEMRAALAQRFAADGTCPMTSAMFLRIAAEASLEERTETGAAAHTLLPFWRILDRKSPVTGKLSCGPEFVEQMRESEGLPT
jgi:hypothetical protein